MPEYSPTEKDRQKVKALAAVGVPQTHIAASLKMDPKTLRRHFRSELDSGAMEADAQVVGALFKMATQDKNVYAAIFWCKARLGWRDRSEVTHVVGPGLSHEERLAQLEAGPDGGMRHMIEGESEAMEEVRATASQGWQN